METVQLTLPMDAEPARKLLNFPLSKSDAELEALRAEAAKRYPPRRQRTLTPLERYFGAARHRR